MPFLTLRHASDATGCRDGNPSLEIASLHMDCEKHGQSCKNVVCESHISIVVCGWSHSKWVCWAFSKTEEDPTKLNEDLTEDWDIFQEDHVATDGNGPEDGRTINLEHPIWCARSYWLTAVDTRMRMVHREWKRLVKSTEADVDAWVRQSVSETPSILIKG